MGYVCGPDFKLGRFQELIVFTSRVCLLIAFYFSEKKSGTAEAKRKVAILVEKLKITVVDEGIVKQSISHSAIHDFEDGIQYFSALNAGCKTIITEDVEDFYFSEIPVLGCEAFLKGGNLISLQPIFSDTCPKK